MQIELGPAELYFCAPDTPSLGEAHFLEIKTGNVPRRFWVRVVLSKAAPHQALRATYELFWREETPRGLTEVFRRDGTAFLTPDEAGNVALLQRQLAQHLNRQAARMWRPAPDSRFVLALNGAGDGAIIGASERTHFVWKNPVGHAQFPCWSEGFDAHFAALFADETSALRRAYEWQGWDDKTRDNHVLRCEIDSFAEMRSLAERLVFLTYAPGEEYYYYDAWRLFETSPHSAPTDIMSVWGAALRAHFRPAVLNSNAPAYERQWLDSWDSWDSRVCIEPLSEAPSAHEVIEAPLVLTEWARENAPGNLALLEFPDFTR